MKYVMLEIEQEGLKRRVPIIFPNQLTHVGIAELMAQFAELKGARAVSAGDCTVDVECGGKSTTLKLSADKSDAALINSIDYLHGILE
jgi:hypothetical protein